MEIQRKSQILEIRILTVLFVKLKGQKQIFDFFFFFFYFYPKLVGTPGISRVAIFKIDYLRNGRCNEPILRVEYEVEVLE